MPSQPHHLRALPAGAPRAGRAVILGLGIALTSAATGGCAGAQPPAATDTSTGEVAPTDPQGAARRPVPEVSAARLAEAAGLVRAARALETRAIAGAGAADAALADSARATYLRAAQLVPAAADWLRLRALALQPDASARARDRESIAVPAARERVDAVEATARARGGDLAGAAGAWEALGAEGTALALRLEDATRRGDAAARAQLRGALVTLLRDGLARGGALGATRAPGADRADVREVATLLDSAFAPLPAEDRLLVARALTAAGTASARTAAAWSAALAAGVGTPEDHAAHGSVLARLGRWREAAAAYARAPGGEAAFQAARARLRAGDGAGARGGLQRVLAQFPTDPAAASARYLLGDLAVDDGREGDARAAFRAVALQHPQSGWAPLAAFRAGLLAYTAGQHATAAAELDTLVARWPDAEERIAATYWAGRAWAAVGDAPRARERWRDVVAREPASYYAGLAAQRLSQEPWTPPPGAVPVATADEQATASATAQRATILERLGMGAEAGWERDWLTRWAEGSVPRQLGAATALQGSGRPGPSIRLALRAVEAGAPRTIPTYRLLNPLLYGDALRREAVARGIEPALAAALVKQESNFTADAVSPAGARGLMQLMPDVGRSLYTARDASVYGAWTPARLFEPDVNITLGMRHLRAALSGWPHPAYALAAYNAGGSRVRRWRQSPGTTDPEVFVERIPYEETRDYVRIVLRGRTMYGALYPDALGSGR
jgi:soluble lytic murein transglycosylase